MQTSSAVSLCHAERKGPRDDKHIVACVDRSRHAQKVVSHAFAVAGALRLPVALLQVLETPSINDFRLDPVEWDIRRHESRNTLTRLTEVHADGKNVVDAELIEGKIAEEICRKAQDGAAELIVLGTQGESEVEYFGIGSTVRHVLGKAPGAVLLVPVVTAPAVPRYRRILVPLDGSSWSESVLPIATRLAHGADAEIILVYVVPVPELIETYPLEAEDIELRERLIARNERVARSYLDRVRSYTADRGRKVRTLTLRGDDIRGELIGLIDRERVDIAVFSARGHGGPRGSDAPYGNVAAHLIAHSSIPMLIVGLNELPGTMHAPTNRESGRSPVRPVV